MKMGRQKQLLSRFVYRFGQLLTPRYTHYQLSDPRVAKLLGLADELLADVARGVYECTRYALDEKEGEP